MIVAATGFIPLSPLSIVLTMVMREMTNFRLFQTEDFADNNFIFENGEKFSLRVESMMEKQFLFFPHSVLKRLFLERVQ